MFATSRALGDYRRENTKRELSESYAHEKTGKELCYCEIRNQMLFSVG